MPPLGFSGSIMGVVAYGEVKTDGSSDFQNSGHYKTARTGPGNYTLTPTSFGDVQTDALSQCYVQVKNAGDAANRVVSVITDASTPPTGIFTIKIRDENIDPIDADFSFMILRSTITPPVGSPA